jgi:hypothetical protein
MRTPPFCSRRHSATISKKDKKEVRANGQFKSPLRLFIYSARYKKQYAARLKLWKAKAVRRQT